MAHLPPDTGVGPDQEPTTGTPRWVMVSGIIALVVVLLFVIVLLVGGGHSPGRHTSSGDAGGRHVAISVSAHGVHQG